MSYMGFLLVFQVINKKVAQFAWYHPTKNDLLVAYLR